MTRLPVPDATAAYEPPLHVAVVGAGPSGLAAARAFRALGMTVTVYEAAPDIGGVWSATREYPGLSTQNRGKSYSFSDATLSSAAPVPTGPEVRAYLHDFARRTGIDAVVRRSTRVTDARYVDGGWLFDAVDSNGTSPEHADWLVVANGLFSKPYIPEYPGSAEFTRAGGRILAPSAVGDGAVLAGKDVVVVGWGKSAADIAVAAAGVARSTTMVVRRLGWKVPLSIGVVPWERAMLSRAGERLLWGLHRTRTGRAIGRPFSRALFAWMRHTIATQQRLAERGLHPGQHGADIDHIMTEGLLEAIDDGRITVRSGRRISRLGAEATVSLDDGTVLAADVVVAATGFDLDLDLFAPETRDVLTGGTDELALVRHILPRTLPRLGFVGWTGSFRSPFTAEMQAVWLAAVVAGLMPIPRNSEDKVYRLDRDKAAAERQRRLPENASFPVLDQWLDDLGLRVPWWRRRAELFGPVDPSAYADVLPRLARRAGSDRRRPPAPDGTAEPPRRRESALRHQR